MTSGVVLDAQREIFHGNVLHQGDGLVGAHLGHSDGGCLVAVHASTGVDWDSVMHASKGAHLGYSAIEQQFAPIGWIWE